MLKYFLDNKEKENAFLFKKLNISKEKKFCKQYQNKFPVIFLSFKDIKAKTFNEMIQKIVDFLSDEYTRHIESKDYLANETLKEEYIEFSEKKATKNNISDGINLLIKALYAQYKISPIVLIDEYDVPLNEAYENGYFNEFATVFTTMLSSALKDNPLCSSAVITGCLQIAKNNLFTGLNNPLINNVSDCTKYNTAFGFTLKEVHEMLEYYKLEIRENDIKNWYDGYRFNNIEIYNPFSVVNAISRINDDINTKLINHWINTSENNLLNKMLFSCSENISLKDKFEALVNHEKIETVYSTTVTYDSILENEAAIFGTLLFTGYLTLNEKELLYIPNKEVMDNFKLLVEEYNKKQKEILNPLLLNALLSKDPNAVSSIINHILRTNISYNDITTINKEVLAGVLAGNLISGWDLASNHESGMGRPDIRLYNSNSKVSIILEFKKANSFEEIDKKLKEAETQIIQKEYGLEDKEYGYELIRYAICSYNKSVKTKIINS